MNIGLIGLGRMGRAIAKRLLHGGYTVYGYDVDKEACKSFDKFRCSLDLYPELKISGVQCNVCVSIKEMVQTCDKIWLMLPAGDVVDTVLDDIRSSFPSTGLGTNGANKKSNAGHSVLSDEVGGDVWERDLELNEDKKSNAVRPERVEGNGPLIIVDGGNSYFKDSIRRAQNLEKENISYLDCGTSGGLHAEKIGFSLMIGGNKEAYQRFERVFKVLAAPNGYGYMGPSGSGHYVKMVHNGIEYALLESYAEGFQMLKEGNYKDLNLEEISNIWMNGSIIRSWILVLAQNIFEKDQAFDHVAGKIGGGQTGSWAVQTAKEDNISIPILDEALRIRNRSKETGGNYATKLVSMLRNEFGGHKVFREDDE